ncbi:MAG: FAD-dependent oxidoreductase [Candidatus Melainabacteria bacterium]|nr:FAD-dependent oxidoreductase [Candidatus Melainabacteria bacterium]
MIHNNKRDVIIIGAGISGLGTAKLLAQSRLDVLVINRRNNIDCNLSGLIELALLEEIFGKIQPDSSENFLQRKIIEKRAYYLQDNDSTMVNFKPVDSENQTYSVLKKNLKTYLSQSCKVQGVEFLFDAVVRELIIQNGSVVGVRTDDKEYFSNIVVIAEGPKMILTKSQGLRIGEVSPSSTLLFAEECIQLPANKINQLFDTDGYGGITMKFFTSFSCESQTKGFGYLNLNKHNFSIGVGIPLKESIENKINVNDYLQKLKKHKILSEYFNQNHKVIGDYSYILPMPLDVSNRIIIDSRLSIDGCLVVGAAASLVRIFDWDLHHMPLLSAKHAANVIISAKSKNDFSNKSLISYQNKIINEVLEKDLLKNHEFSSGLKLLTSSYSNLSDSNLYDDLNLYVTNKGVASVRS